MLKPHDATRVLNLRAPAKINLALAVGPPLPPKGYHPIASWFAPIELFDELRLEALPQGSASVHEIAWEDGRAIDWPLDKDLAVRAHRLIEQRLGHEPPIRLQQRSASRPAAGSAAARPTPPP